MEWKAIEFCILCRVMLDAEEKLVWFCSRCEHQMLSEILEQEEKDADNVSEGG
jgi:hypothetical protein